MGYSGDSLYSCIVHTVPMQWSIYPCGPYGQYPCGLYGPYPCGPYNFYILVVPMVSIIPVVPLHPGGPRWSSGSSGPRPLISALHLSVIPANTRFGPKHHPRSKTSVFVMKKSFRGQGPATAAPGGAGRKTSRGRASNKQVTTSGRNKLNKTKN